MAKARSASQFGSSGATEGGPGAKSRARWAAGDVTGYPAYPKDDRRRLDPAATIRILVKGNPKKGAPATRYEHYVNGMTVGAFAAEIRNLGLPERIAFDDILWDASRGFIAIEPPGASIWTVPEAKARLSEILRLAREGAPQTIGANEPCVVISAAMFDELRSKRRLGRFLLATAPRGSEIELPPRSGDRGDPFADDAVL
jgi:prevent-host-death family protein